MPTASPPTRTILSRARGARLVPSRAGIANGERLVLRWCTDDSVPPKKCDGEESECKCVDHDGNIDRRVDFYTHGFVFENEAGQVCLPAGA